MADDGKWDTARAGEPADNDAPHERSERGLSDLVKRAMAAGLDVASRSKDDIVRVAASEIASEMRSWLDHMDVQSEIAKVLAKMVVEVKAEIRFRPKEDGTLVPEATTDLKVKPPAKP
jgi:hypothetical protein